MRLHGITAVVNMCAEWVGPRAEYDAVGIEQLRLPTVGTTSPTVESLEAGVAFIRSQLNHRRGSRIFIHCKAGRGRAVTMALAWYIETGMAAPEALALLKAKRGIVSPQVLEYRAVREFIRRRGKAASTTKRSLLGRGREDM